MRVDFFFDPVCPFCWMTSKWIRRVTPRRGLEVDWRFISLEMINRDRDPERPPKPSHAAGLELLRVAAAAKNAHGGEATGHLYESMGNLIWETEARRRPENVLDFAANGEVAAALTMAGLPADLAGARWDESWDAVIGEDGATALARTGGDVGTPIITYEAPAGPSFFGPVISSLPDDDESVAMWDAVVTLGQLGDFAEIKRSMRAGLDLPVIR